MSARRRDDRVCWALHHGTRALQGQAEGPAPCPQGVGGRIWVQGV